MKKQILKERYEAIVDEYITLFEKKHNLELEFWVADDKSGTACFGDINFFNISDIMFDIDNKLPKGLILDWLNDSVEFHETKGYINLESYSKGVRFQDRGFIWTDGSIADRLLDELGAELSRVSREDLVRIISGK